MVSTCAGDPVKAATVGSTPWWRLGGGPFFRVSICADLSYLFALACIANIKIFAQVKEPMFTFQ